MCCAAPCPFGRAQGDEGPPLQTPRGRGCRVGVPGPCCTVAPRCQVSAVDFDGAEVCVWNEHMGDQKCKIHTYPHPAKRHTDLKKTKPNNPLERRLCYATASSRSLVLSFSRARWTRVSLRPQGGGARRRIMRVFSVFIAERWKNKEDPVFISWRLWASDEGCGDGRSGNSSGVGAPRAGAPKGAAQSCLLGRSGTRAGTGP